MINTQSGFVVIKTPTFMQSLCTMVAIIIVIGAGFFFLKLNFHVLLLISILIGASSAWLLGYKFYDIRLAMNGGVCGALSAIYIFILIGVLIAALIESGTLATLIYYGIRFSNPVFFLPTGLILCSIMSIATGTSWGTVGAIGVVLMTVGSTFGIPAPLTAGMVISGASFGDKMSPISDTTNLAAMASKTTIHSHIHSMLFTTGPAYFLVLVIFSIIGLNYADNQLAITELFSLQKAIEDSFCLNFLTFMPIIVMLCLSLLRVSAEPTMIAATLTAILLAIFLQGAELTAVLNGVYDGASIKTGHEGLDNLMSRGGIISMMQTLSLSLLALALGGILESCQFIQVLITTVLRRIKRKSTLVATTITSCFIGNMAMGEAYMSIVLGGQLFGDCYDQNNVHRKVLSRSLEEGSTLTSSLIPWTTGGVFFASILSVPVLDYAPWALLNWISPLMAILFAYLGVALFRNNNSIAKECATLKINK
ncbi:MAG: Na+/H+ antiporter NhaC [Candidatus Endonucleobacter bathymodioli]|uniref:Na+/H+ antiporter NhaC n=1 Tax=Candidatus Endonucleibacter bathymodioli TaxID=539814 RepID=A0AA90NT69_9GAMM|nr:Na+/H+ antiporter NhaC [Candidatus Endonucleobacter bathymodioli]